MVDALTTIAATVAAAGVIPYPNPVGVPDAFAAAWYSAMNRMSKNRVWGKEAVRCSFSGGNPHMYIGIGTLVLILVIILIIYFARGTPRLTHEQVRATAGAPVGVR